MNLAMVLRILGLMLMMFSVSMLPPIGVAIGYQDGHAHVFAASFALHAVGGTAKHNEQLLDHGNQPITLAAYLATSQFWFESFQNWQSEFLSVAVLVLLSIVLRERGSPQSKPVAAPHGQTGIR